MKIKYINMIFNNRCWAHRAITALALVKKFKVLTTDKKNNKPRDNQH